MEKIDDSIKCIRKKCVVGKLMDDNARGSKAVEEGVLYYTRNSWELCCAIGVWNHDSFRVACHLRHVNQNRIGAKSRPSGISNATVRFASGWSPYRSATMDAIMRKTL